MLEKTNEKIEDKIYEIRGEQIMLDSDLAKIYKCKNGTKTINQAVKRHLNRFPERFMFRLTDEEYYQILRSQIGTLELQQGKYSKYLPFAFTEQGVAMLATVIRTEVAEQVSVDIMDAFVRMRHFINNNMLMFKDLEEIKKLTIQNTNDINFLQDTFNKFKTKDKKEYLYFNGQVFDSYSKLIDIMKAAKIELIIIDSYADKVILDMISKIDMQVILITSNNTKLKSIDLDKYNNQYNNLKVYYDNSFHDRFLVLDKKIIYHCGASLNHAGNKTFAINKLEDISIVNLLIYKINKIVENNVV